MTTLLELQHFAVLEVSYLHKPTSIIITCRTNNPCHLTLYYTEKEPVRHATSLVKRGLAVPWGAYFCFVAWNSVEQQEAGDTLIHTFEVPDWSYCQVKWFTFRGTVSEVLSPSVTALLKHHHPGVLGTMDLKVWQKAYYRVQRSADPIDPVVLYNLVHDQEQADSYNTGIIIYGQRLRGVGAYGYAMIRRTAITFYTRLLPPCTLLQAVLRLDIRKVSPPRPYSDKWDWYLKIRAGHDLNTEITHKDLANYSKILALGTQIGSKYGEDLPPYGYQDYWYIDVPLEFINLDGFTVITSLISKDETKTPPAHYTVEEPLFIKDSFTILHIAYLQK
ncbi:hypothetical protein ES708_22009 [subsurface metagenome]